MFKFLNLYQGKDAWLEIVLIPYSMDNDWFEILIPVIRLVRAG